MVSDAVMATAWLSCAGEPLSLAAGIQARSGPD
jgi:hypothetical protein